MFNKLRIYLGGCDHKWVEKKVLRVYRGNRMIGYEYHRQCTKCLIVRAKLIDF